MTTQIIKQAARLVAPRWAAELYRSRSAVGQSKSLRARCAGLGLEDLVEEVRVCQLLKSMQKPGEILRLLEIVRDLRPRTFCEIGSAGGGTLALFCHVADPSARILSLDLGFNPIQLAAYPHLSLEGQDLTCLAADTHAGSTLEKVTGWLGGGQLDFLFIDGDHSFAGVECDFRMYAPLVRDGGLIAFHDIVPDFKTRFGLVTASDVGEVPAFWASLKEKVPGLIDLVDDPGQDGFGIGVMNWSPDVAAALLG